MISGAKLAFQKAIGDLEPKDEFWSKKTYAQCKAEIEKHNIAATRKLPSKNMSYIRTCMLPISENTTMLQLVNLASVIGRKFHIHCFQITVDRENMMATLLMDFYDRKASSTVTLNVCQINYLYVYMLRHLGIKASLTPSLLRRYLISQYKDDKTFFRRCLVSLRRANIGRKDYENIRMCLMYVEKNLEGVTK